MKTRNIFSLVLLCATLHMAGPARAQAADGLSEQSPLYTYASELYRQGRWSGAYGRFAKLADGGHVDAARLALHMLRHGPALYGSQWGASQPQIDLWTRLSGMPYPYLVSVTGD